MVRYLFYTIGDLTYQSPLVTAIRRTEKHGLLNQGQAGEWDYCAAALVRERLSEEECQLSEKQCPCI